MKLKMQHENLKIMETGYRNLSLVLVMLLSLLLAECTGPEKNVFTHYAWVEEIREDHPRLFFHRESFVGIRDRALKEERAWLEEIQSRVDGLVGREIEFSDPLAEDGTQNPDHLYGTRAAEAAFLYLVFGENKYLELSRKILAELVAYYRLRNENNLNIQWYAFSRMDALAAYDWIFNDLSEKERREIGEDLLYAIDYMPSADRGAVFRRNTGGIQTGFYGPPCLPWYAGLVFHQTGIDDSLSLELLKKGYDDHTALLEFRSRVAGDDGGAASAVLAYCMGAYPWAEFNFFHSFRSATGIDLASEWPYVPKFINYIFWNWLPGDRQFGYGDASHRENELPMRYLHLHLSQMVHFYGHTQPELIALAKWMLTKTRKQNPGVFPYAPFLLTNTHPHIRPEGPSGRLPRARHFEHMGQLFMRSGSGPDDTYALFTAGGMLTQHRHYDNNNFVIFKKGFLALDAGTRPQPGLHLSHYYARTVAHNCITIRMPGEIMPPYWDSGPALSEEPAETYPNDGGQLDRMGSEIIAFDEKAEYVYVASDATASYHPDKARLVLRQFVFLPPDHFVIYDKVTSFKPEYHKRWLLHTASEPQVNDPEFYADHWGGRIFCRTLYPEDAVLKKRGGPGKQFWSDGRNWALPELTPRDWNYKNMQWLDNDHDLFGQWRMEVSPAKPNREDFFLHLLQVGDTTLQQMSHATTLMADDMMGVRFSRPEETCEVWFSRHVKMGGKIKLSRNGQVILEENLSDQVKAQTGLY